jgi:hypothetical protein
VCNNIIIISLLYLIHNTAGQHSSNTQQILNSNNTLQSTDIYPTVDTEDQLETINGQIYLEEN